MQPANQALSANFVIKGPSSIESRRKKSIKYQAKAETGAAVVGRGVLIGGSSDNPTSIEGVAIRSRMSILRKGSDVSQL